MTDTDASAQRTCQAAAPGGAAGAAGVPAIGLDGVVKEFHSRGEVVAAVRGIDLAIRKGEFFSMLGPSGCGKTTTMRMIAGFEEPTRGTIRLDGRDVTAAPPNKRDVNMVFQSYALFPHMSVFENVAFGLRRKTRRPRTEITRQVGEMLEIVDLAGRERAPPAGAVRRPAAARGAGPGAGQPPQGPAAGRAARAPSTSSSARPCRSSSSASSGRSASRSST